MASVEFRKMRKSFGAIAFFHRVDLSIRNGNFFVPAGLSGRVGPRPNPALHAVHLFTDARCRRLTA